MDTIRVGSAIADHVIAHFAARRFDGLVHLARRHTEAFRHNLEVIDERLHLGLHLFTVRQNYVRRIRRPAAARHAFERLFHDARALPHFLNAHLVARIDIAFGLGRNLEIELLVAGIGLALARIVLQARRPQHGSGNTQVQHVFYRHVADAARAPNPNTIIRQQLFILVHFARKRFDECPYALLPTARRFERQSADAEVTGHHALARVHLEDPQNVFALAEAI